MSTMERFKYICLAERFAKNVIIDYSAIYIAVFMSLQNRLQGENI